jgi:hypothetical protein
MRVMRRGEMEATTLLSGGLMAKTFKQDALGKLKN